MAGLMGIQGGEDMSEERVRAASSHLFFAYIIILGRNSVKRNSFMLQSHHSLILLSGLAQSLASPVPGVVRTRACGTLQRRIHPFLVTSSGPWCLQDAWGGLGACSYPLAWKATQEALADLPLGEAVSAHGISAG